MIDDRCLDLAAFPVRGLAWGETTRWLAGRLEVSRAALMGELAAESRLRVVDAGLFSPGESVRLVDVLDIVEPRAKASGPGEVFAGVLGPPEPSGQGRTNRLQGAAVVICGRFADEGDELRRPQPAHLDLAGPGAFWTPYSGLHMVALQVEPAPGTDNAGMDAAVRRTACLAARHLARCTAGEPSPGGRALAFTGGPDELPCVAQVVFLPTFGRLMDTRVYGESAGELLPLPLHPDELQDGALVCADYHYAGQRSYTIGFQWNAVGDALARRHAHTLRVGPLVCSRIHNTDAQKRRAACQTADLVRMLGADAAVVSAAAAGNAHIDAMFTARALEAQGLRTAVIQVEMSGPSGDDPPLVDFVAEADLIVSTGNREQRVSLPPVERVFGGPCPGSAGGRELPLREICGANHQLGGGRLTARSG